jgi:hypothetical protein
MSWRFGGRASWANGHSHFSCFVVNNKSVMGQVKCRDGNGWSIWLSVVGVSLICRFSLLPCNLAGLDSWAIGARRVLHDKLN